MNQQVTPADAVVAAFGGLRAAARALDEQVRLADYPGLAPPVHPSMLSRWRSMQRTRGGAGNIPQWWHQPILDAAERLGVDLTIEALIYRPAGTEESS